MDRYNRNEILALVDDLQTAADSPIDQDKLMEDVHATCETIREQLRKEALDAATTHKQQMLKGLGNVIWHIENNRNVLGDTDILDAVLKSLKGMVHCTTKRPDLGFEKLQDLIDRANEEAKNESMFLSPLTKQGIRRHKISVKPPKR